MATSQNGYTVHVDQSQLAVLPWVTGRVLPGDVWTVLDYVCRRYHAEVEPIRKDWSWGYAYRAIRGQTSGYSNHASGTAIDLNAPRHPLGASGTFTDAQVRAIRSILNDLGGAIRWGGDYQRRPDEMHFEIDATPRRIAEVAAAIRAGKLGGIRPAPGLPGTGVDNTPDPLPTPEPDPLEEIMAMYASKEEFEKAQRDIVYSVLAEFTKHDYQRTVDRIKVGTREALELPVSPGRADEWGATVLDSAARAAFRAGVVDGLSRETLAIVKDLAARSGVDVDEAAVARSLAASLAPVVREALAGEVADDVADRVVAKLGAALTQG